ncbi:MAG TPA: hypothetical protein VL754_21805 [Verrucomicrobiae bacterium]|nr:hypothetical protein [Verrucomicrobiae bacterium]
MPRAIDTGSDERRKIFAAISLISASTLLLELGLTRLFSATMYYHFAFMAISLALFGSGASGVFIYLARDRLARVRTGSWLTAASLLFAMSALLALYTILANPIAIDAYTRNNIRLLTIYAVSALPFFFAGCAITMAITRFAGEIDRLYLFDLAGAAAGCMLLIPVLNLIGAVNLVLLVSVLAVVAAIISNASRRSPIMTFLLIELAAGLSVAMIYNGATGRFDVHPNKGTDESHLLFSKWNSISRVTAVGDLDAPEIRIIIDSDAATDVSKGGGEMRTLPGRPQHLSAFGYHIKRAPRVLIIGSGGGKDVIAARAFGAASITAVEVNPVIALDVMSSEPFKSYAGSIYQQPEVRLVVDEGRSFIRSRPDRYDIIQAVMVDTWAATAAGAFALTESNLYTVEAFKDYIAHLTDDGLLTMTRWYFEPPDQLLRLTSLARATMAELGIDHPERHLLLVRQKIVDSLQVPATFLFKKSAFTDDEVRRLERIAVEEGFVILYTPLTRPANVFTQLIETVDLSRWWNSFENNVEPTRDNNPFFFNSIRLSRITSLSKGAGEWQKTNLGTSILFKLLGITTLFVLIFLIGPLWFAHGGTLQIRTREKLSYLLYFACLGAGFIIIEVVMIQKFILFLGHPVYSLTVILFSLFVFSAVGSRLTGRFREDRLAATLSKVLIAIAALTALYLIVLPPIFYNLVHWARPLRIAITVIMLAPLALLLGMPMPLGIRLLTRRMPEIIPWAWGVNGATSVMGSVAALVIALLTGFNQALMTGAVLYLLAVFFIAERRPRRPQTEAEEA